MCLEQESAYRLHLRRDVLGTLGQYDYDFRISSMRYICSTGAHFPLPRSLQSTTHMMKDNHKSTTSDASLVVQLPGGYEIKLPPGTKVLAPVTLAENSQFSSGGFASRHDPDNTLGSKSSRQTVGPLKLLERRLGTGGTRANDGISSDGKSEGSVSLDGNDNGDITSTDDSGEESGSGTNYDDISNDEDSAGSFIDSDS